MRDLGRRRRITQRERETVLCCVRENNNAVDTVVFCAYECRVYVCSEYPPPLEKRERERERNAWRFVESVHVIIIIEEYEYGHTHTNDGDTTHCIE